MVVGLDGRRMTGTWHQPIEMLKMGRKRFEAVDNYVYLRSLDNRDNKIEEEFRRRATLDSVSKSFFRLIHAVESLRVSNWGSLARNMSD